MPVSTEQYVQLAEERIAHLKTIEALQRALRDSEDELRVAALSNRALRAFIRTLEYSSTSMSTSPSFDHILGRK